MQHTERNLKLRRNEIESMKSKLPKPIYDSLWKKLNQDEADFLREQRNTKEKS